MLLFAETSLFKLWLIFCKKDVSVIKFMNQSKWLAMFLHAISHNFSGQNFFEGSYEAPFTMSNETSGSTIPTAHQQRD